MKPIWKFRLLALLVIVVVGGISISDLAAEFLRPTPVPLPSRTSKSPDSNQVSLAGQASSIAPFRSDLKADYAMALAAQTLKLEYTGQAQTDETAQNVVKSVLRIGPLDSRMWLILALLKARSNLGDPLIAESLKMSYLTGQTRAELIPVRLDYVTLNNSLTDSDLRDFARGDVRAILTRYPDQRQVLVNDYIRASPIGKAFLEESVRMVDPKFVDLLRSAR